jgi:hypothetical protein
MVPLFISAQFPVQKMIMIIGMKAVLGVFYGFLIDIVIRRYRRWKNRSEIEKMKIDELCKREHCHCEEEAPKISAHRGNSENKDTITKASVAKEMSSSHDHSHEGRGNILHSALIHTIHIFIYILIFTLLLNALIEFVGEDTLAGILQRNAVLSHGLAGIVGLIPNCAASIVITELYLNGIITFGAMMSGLLVGAGVGLLILFRVNEGTRRNIQITAILYLIGTFTGFILDLLGIMV